MVTPYRESRRRPRRLGGASPLVGGVVDSFPAAARSEGPSTSPFQGAALRLCFGRVLNRSALSLRRMGLSRCAILSSL